MKEMIELLTPMGVEVINQGSLGIEPAEEPFKTFIENSLAKARHASAESGLPAIADDSGICVDALGGAPGVLSARYAGEPSNDANNNKKLIKELKDKTNRHAHYVCVLTAVRSPDDPEPLIAVGYWEGEIIDVALGTGGFGYDPYFRVKGTRRTAAEMPSEEKNAHSHRGQAMKKMRELISLRWGW